MGKVSGQTLAFRGICKNFYSTPSRIDQPVFFDAVLQVKTAFACTISRIVDGDIRRIINLRAS